MTKIPKLIPLTKEAQIKHDEFIKRCMESLNPMTKIPEEARLTDEELIEKCLEGVKKRRFKPDWKGFSSCIQCERDTVGRAIPIITKQAQEDERKRIANWGQELCYKHYVGNMLRRQCDNCWQELLEGRDPSQEGGE